jgi:hypothetical protein
MKVQVQERLDGETILCKVSWGEPSTNNTIRLLVRVPATLDEFSEEGGAEIVPVAIRSMALLRARDVADAFSNLVNENLQIPTHRRRIAPSAPASRQCL